MNCIIKYIPYIPLYRKKTSAYFNQTEFLIVFFMAHPIQIVNNLRFTFRIVWPHSYSWILFISLHITHFSLVKLYTHLDPFNIQIICYENTRSVIPTKITWFVLCSITNLCERCIICVDLPNDFFINMCSIIHIVFPLTIIIHHFHTQWQRYKFINT